MSTVKKHSNLIESRRLFEDLPNETLILIFSYLSGVDIVWSFSNLNCRFYCLSNQCCSSFDFESINKTKFDFILRQQENKHQWKSLKLSNEQFEYISHLFSLVDVCPELECLSSLEVESISAQNNPLLLSKLSRLTLKSACATEISQFDLSKLKHLVISSCRDAKWMKVK